MGDGHDRLPDQAALDELSRAFADHEPADAAARVGSTARDTSADRSGGLDDRDDEHDEAVDLAGDESVDDESVDHESLEDESPDDDGPFDLLIVEQEPATDPAPDPAPDPPPLIRIDDLAGSTELVDPGPGEHPSGEQDEARDDRSAGSDEPVVISIDDEELPDAVYVEGSLDRDGSRSIVIIEDDDTGDTLAPEAEREVRRGIEPRMRERRVAVKRAQGRKRLKWVGLIAAIVIVVVGTLAVLGSSLFAIREDRVTITGNVYADPAAVQAVIDDLVGTPSLRADTHRAEEELEAIPWVETARVRVDFPDGASIEIREREAWSTYQGPDQRFRVLDEDGRVLDVIDGYPFAYVLLGGPDPVDLDAGEFAPRGYAAASALAKNLTGSVRTRVDRIEVTADGSQLSLFLDDGTEVRFGEARDILAKLVRLETVLTSGEERPPGLIDVSTREVTVPGGGSGQDGG